jgi:hypothetical protein
MLAAIVCLEIPLTSLRGKFKLSQNRTAEDRSGVERLLGEGPDPGSRALAHLGGTRECPARSGAPLGALGRGRNSQRNRFGHMFEFESVAFR